MSKIKILIVGTPKDSEVLAMVQAIKERPEVIVVDIETKEKLASELLKQDLELKFNSQEYVALEKSERDYEPKKEREYDHKVDRGRWN